MHTHRGVTLGCDLHHRGFTEGLKFMMKETEDFNSKILKDFQTQSFGALGEYITQLKGLGYDAKTVLEKVEAFLKDVVK